MDDPQKMFLDLYTANQRRLYCYIVTLIPNRSDAEDIFSETTLVLWEKWTQFDPTRSFIAWACGIARHKVLQHQAKPERRWEGLTEQVIAMISEDRDKLQHILDRRSKALVLCIEHLKAWQRQLLKTCYLSAASITTIARELGKTPVAIRLRLHRIRKILHDCVDRTIQLEEPPQ